jgi:glycosyltransferase involved in cell wall biosynthesis
VSDLRVSVVVPTRDRPESLARCLSALESQEGVNLVEIVVVDDGSKDAMAVAEAVASHSRARLLRLQGRGPAAARNAGVASVTAPFVCFTDDDCTPCPDWAAKLAAALAGGAPAAGGRTTPVRPDSPFASASGILSVALREPEHGPHPYTMFASTSNLGVRASILHEVPFDEGYLFASEDRDWCARLTARGYELEIVPNAAVIHHRDDDLPEFWRRYVRYGEGSYRFRRMHSGGRPAEPGFYAHLVRQGFSRSPAVGALVCVSQLATSVGYAKAALAGRLRR